MASEIFAGLLNPSRRQEASHNRAQSILQRHRATERRSSPQATLSNPESFATLAISHFAHDFTRIPASFQRTMLSARTPGQPKSFAATETERTDADEEMPSQGSDSPVTSVNTAGTPATDIGASDNCPPGAAWISGKHIVPNFFLNKPAPVITNSRKIPSETYIPDPTFTGQVAVDCDAKMWRLQVDSVKSTGNMKIVYFTEDHYPAPSPKDDAGQLTNVKKDNWEAMITDLDENKDGIDGSWGSYRAVDDHEDFHWTYWQEQFKKEFSRAESDIDQLGVSFVKAATATDAEKTLWRKVHKVFKKAVSRALDACFDIGDEPGAPPYQAQIPAVERLISRIKDYASANFK